MKEMKGSIRHLRLTEAKLKKNFARRIGCWPWLSSARSTECKEVLWPFGLPDPCQA